MDIRDSQRIKQIRDNTEKMADAFSRIADALERLTEPNNCKTCRHYKPDHEAIACERCLGGKYSRYEPQVFTYGKEVHEYCKRNCSESKARMRDGDRFIVCGQANDEICISLGKCPLGKWVAGEGFHILPMDEPQTDCAWKGEK